MTRGFDSFQVFFCGKTLRTELFDLKEQEQEEQNEQEEEEEQEEVQDVNLKEQQISFKKSGRRNKIFGRKRSD